MSTHQSIPKPANAKKKSDILPIPAQSKPHPVIAQPKIESTRSNEEQLAQIRAKREASERLGSTLLTPKSVPHTPPPLQPKLTIGQPGDMYEQEADRVARQVVDQINAPPQIQAKAPRNPMQSVGELKPSPLDHHPVMKVQRQATGGEMNASADGIGVSGVPKENKTGLPNNLKAGIENLSGMSMDDVKVHYNSSKPAQLKALAYTQGTDIYVGQGQEKHLPHEAWHVVQQKQGRVQPTMQMKDTKVNDDLDLEKEADIFGGKAKEVGQHILQKRGVIAHELTYGEKQESDAVNHSMGTVQRALGFELEVDIPVSQYIPPDDAQLPDVRNIVADWDNAVEGFPEADPHGNPPVPQTVIYQAVNGGVTVDAVPDKKGLDFVPSGQILEIRVSPIDTANITGLAATMNNVLAGINPLYNGIRAGNPQNNRFHIPVQGAATPAMVGLPNGNDPNGNIDNAKRLEVSWRTYMQATAGVRTDRIGRLGEKIRHGAQPGDDLSLDSLQSSVTRYQDIARDARAAAIAVYNAVHWIQPNLRDAIVAEKEAVLGFLTLICTYLIGGGKAYQGQGNRNPKNMTALFSRSGFHQIRTQTLSAQSEQWIRANNQSFREQLVKFTRHADADDRMYSPLFNRLGMAHPTQTVMIFLNDALNRNQDRYTQSEAKSIIPPENVGAALPGAVLEFRRIANPGNNPAAWVAKISEVVTAIHHVNT
ncbi:MAG: DUF4157 domain-containing protein [Coleofasciculus sp. A1-SPW-01]|uniref:eCIS core domain-containing protein n=1 Tax=Coleofasciculus sp. A1-SPW-01 TaxID=3070819 RepID=UPI0032F629DF